MTIDALNAVSALDGRYSDQLEGLGQIVSEGGLIGYRIRVEAAWLLHLAEPKVNIIALSADVQAFLHTLAAGDMPDDAASEIKTIEKTTSHDVKAVEYWLRTHLAKLGASPTVLSHIHFACTSEDINNAAYSLMLSDLRSRIILPTFDRLIHEMTSMARSMKGVAMLSRTHGQTATPTTMGKEMAVFAWRLKRQRDHLSRQAILAKFNGAVGNYNAHMAAYPKSDWVAISKDFVVDRLKLQWNPLTTQIENHDAFVEYMTIVRHFNTVLLDLVRDMWGYISLGYFLQKAVSGEVGSSTMPHKVNPIYFENAEGNLGVSSSLLNHFMEKLLVSRWQRDLSDSTVLRVTGTAIGHALLAWKSVLRGLDRVAVNERRINEDLQIAWEVLAEPVQTVMRRYGVADAYEQLKHATRGAAVVTKEMIHSAIDQCAEIPVAERIEMKKWTPTTYIGCAPKLVTEFTPI